MAIGSIRGQSHKSNKRSLRASYSRMDGSRCYNVIAAAAAVIFLTSRDLKNSNFKLFSFNYVYVLAWLFSG